MRSVGSRTKGSRPGVRDAVGAELTLVAVLGKHTNVACLDGACTLLVVVESEAIEAKTARVVQLEASWDADACTAQVVLDA